MIIGPKYVYISVPKCGTHTMYKFLVKQYQGMHLKPPHHGRMVPGEHRSKFRFTVVRHPYTRIISAWQHTLWTPNFPDFMDMVLNDDNPERVGYDTTVPINVWLKGIKFDTIIKLEHLNRGIHSLPFVKERVTVGHEFRGPRINWSDHVKGKLVEMVNEWAGSDFEDYGYTKE